VRSEAHLSTRTLTINAPAEEHDAILLERVVGWAAAGPVSFLRSNKPDWRLEVIHYDPGPLAPDAADAVADSALVLHILDLERQGKAPRSRRELLLRAMRRVTDGVALTPQERLKLHREGYVWAVELGRWDDAAVAGLERRFLTQRDGIAALVASPCDAASETRWERLARADGPSEAAVTQARTAIALHANRLGVFAEVEAILHYFLFRLDNDRKRT
jgi:hypothetical protein